MPPDAIGEIDKRLEEVQRQADTALQAVEQAFNDLGVTSSAELQRQADAARIAYDTIKGSGVASAGDIEEAFIAVAKAEVEVAERADDATKRIVSMRLNSEAETLGLKDDIEAITGALRDTGEQADDTGKQISDAARSSSGDVTELTDIISTAADEYGRLAEEAGRAANNTRSVSTGQLAGTSSDDSSGDGSSSGISADLSSLSARELADAYREASDQLQQVEQALRDTRGRATPEFLRQYEALKEHVRELSQALRDARNPTPVEPTPEPATSSGSDLSSDQIARISSQLDLLIEAARSGGGSGDGFGGCLELVVNLDGREIAREIYPHLEDIRRRSS
jgi:uncharacterized protein YukE